MTSEPEQAERIIQELGTLTQRSREADRSMATGFPLVGWGLAWLVGYPALELLDGVLRIVVVVVAWLAGMALSWLPIRTVIRTGVEERLRWAWLAILAASPFLVTAARPESLLYAALLLGGLWSLGMCLYAVATNDRPYAAVAMVGVVAAGVAGTLEPTGPLVVFGVAAGLPMLAIGACRVLTGARHV